MAEQNIKAMIGETFQELADALETGQFGQKTKVAVTVLGSEHGPEEIIRGAVLSQKQNPDLQVCLIGPENNSGLLTFPAVDFQDQHKKMEELLDAGSIDACVTMHYSFPIGVSTVGLVVTPVRGKEMFLATTTGTSATERVEAMVRNAIYGIIAAKTMGIVEPTLGILNVDGSRQVERALNKLAEKGYSFKWVESARADGGVVMRGNDLLMATPDVMITDTLTGNLLMKMFSSFQTGGDYEAAGYGYGPGIGENYKRTVLILSRASGAPVVANAIKYAGQLANGKVWQVAKAEFDAVNKAGLSNLFEETKKAAASEAPKEIKAPPKEIVTEEIVGIDVMELDDATHGLWEIGIYAETGMGCVGPVILVAEEDHEKAIAELKRAGYC